LSSQQTGKYHARASRERPVDEPPRQIGAMRLFGHNLCCCAEAVTLITREDP
jgi:hypothetical protein